ncbi:hypothetical protein Q5P01_011747 [Channa striata]|uniref:C-type lectin domain-containing protein n=1 Tax=Channa striata TaxID=64152 RepID=A0AA88MY40_CHASR|nr:hypothetical protein Q5P01_011747 [Channa striata]
MTLKNPNVSLSAEKIEEEAIYVNAVNAAVSAVDKRETTPDPKFPSSQLVPLLALCWATLLLIVSLRIYFALSPEYDVKLTKTYNNLQAQYDNLTQAYTVQERNITTLTAQNQELESQRKNLTEQIRDILLSYCPKERNGIKCKACQDGWLHSTSSCYAVNNAKDPDQKTWEEARENCRGKISDLAVIVNEAQKDFTTKNSWNSTGISGYWIGLKVEDGRWKWVDGSNLNNDLWIEAPVNGRCATSLAGKGWKSVSCGERHAWICQKKALSVQILSLN